MDAVGRRRSVAKYPLKVHVWAGISRRGATRIAIWDGKNRMNSELYCRIIEDFYVPFLKNVYNNNYTRDRFAKLGIKCCKISFSYCPNYYHIGFICNEIKIMSGLLFCFRKKMFNVNYLNCIFCLSFFHHMRGGVANAQQRWYNDYGEISDNVVLMLTNFRCYLFGKTELQVADTKILKEVMLQKFSYFTDRVNFIPINGGDRSNLLSNTLLFMTGEKWKNVRSQITPTFTTGKIRMMFPIFNSSAMICGDILQQKQDCGEPIDLKDVCGRLTLDTIAKCGFGADLNVQNTENSSFYEYAKIFFKIDRKSPGLLFLCGPEANSYFTNLLTEIFTKRKEDRMRDDGIRKNDFFDLLLDSLQGENFNGDDNDLLFEEIKNSRKKKLTELDIIAQVCLLILYIYLSAKGFNNLLIFSKIKLLYISLLHHIQVNRICTIPTTVGDGIPIRKNDVISIPIRVIHFNEKLYSEPYKFNPDRYILFRAFSWSCHSLILFIPSLRRSTCFHSIRIWPTKLHWNEDCTIPFYNNLILITLKLICSLPLDFISFGPIKVTNTLNISITPRI
uniref:Cytochrome P450 n=1 Tax=Heterorhabditis bacteriophora TaxID=37862 RepID=A0A1I7WU91_HETBA